MVRIKTKNMELKLNNPWVEVDDVPPIISKAWNWIMSHPRKVKKFMKIAYHKIFKWDWLLGYFLGIISGFLIAFGVWYYIVTQIYPM